MASARKIIHLDMDAFYASVEQRDDPVAQAKARRPWAAHRKGAARQGVARECMAQT